MMIIIFVSVIFFAFTTPIHPIHLHGAFIIRQAIIVKIFACFTFDGVFPIRDIHYDETTCFDYCRGESASDETENHYKTL